MVRGLFVLCASAFAGCTALQASEPIAVNIDFDVPVGGALAQRGSKAGFSAVAASTGQRLRGGAAAEAAELVIHVPASGGGDAAALAIDAETKLAVLSRLAAAQDAQEARALQGAQALAQRFSAVEPVVHAQAVALQSLGSGGGLQELVAEAAAGGYVGRRAFGELLTFAADSAARASVLSSGAVGAAKAALQRQGTDERTRYLAGSLLTMLSGMPVAAGIADAGSGGAGHVEIVLPRPSRVYGPDAAALHDESVAAAQAQA